MLKKNGFFLSIFALEMILCLPAPAGAYTDPNLGNLVYQILFPIITVLSVGYLFCRNYIKRKLISLKNRLWKRTAKDKPSAFDASKER